MLERIIIPLYLFLIPFSAGATNIYVVQKGDNLYDIAKRFGTKIELIKEANNLSTDKLDIGKKLIIPKRDDSVRAREPFYKVQAGDNLGGIARKYGISVAELKRINNLDSDAIVIGQKLRVVKDANPVESVGGTKGKIAGGATVYNVRKGDTMGAIARTYGTTVSALKRLNGLSSDRLRIGQRLLIPGSPAKTIADVVATSSDGSQMSGSTQTFTQGDEDAPYSFIKHRVRRGDTLSQISRRYRVSIAAIKAANGLRSHRIRAGDVLKVPSNGSVVARVRSSEGVAHASLGRSEGSMIVEKLLSSGVIGDSVVSFAKSFIGAPYKFGGTSLVSGIDCSAFVSKVYDYFHVKLPRTARQMFSVGYDVNKSELQSADLVFFTTYAKYPSHVGIYTGDDKFIHASSRAKQVTIGDMRQRYYAKRYIGARRVISADGGYRN